MSSLRPSNLGRRARRRSQLTEIRFLLPDKQQTSTSLSSLGQEEGLQPPGPRRQEDPWLALPVV